MNLYRNLSIGWLTLLSTISSATMIDSFTPIDHTQDITFGEETYVNRSFVGVQTGNMLGGERDVEFIQKLRTAFEPPQFVARFQRYGLYNREFFRFGAFGPGAQFGAAEGSARLQYDGLGDEVGNLGLDKRLTNAGTGIPMFNALDGGIRIWTAGSSGSNQIQTTCVLRLRGDVIATADRTITRSDEFRSTSFEFTPEVFGVADSFSIEINTLRANGDSNEAFFISHIDTVLPEPGTYAAFAAGLACLAWRRRKRTARA